MTPPSEKNPRPKSHSPTHRTAQASPVRKETANELLPLYLSPVGVTWLPVSENETPPDTPSAIAAKLFDLALQPQQKYRSFRLASESDDARLLADAARDSIRRQLNEESDRGLLIRASLKLRRILAKTTGVTLLAMMPLTLTAFTFLGLNGPPRGEAPTPMFIGIVMTVWAIHVVAVSIAVLVQIAGAPQGRAFLPLRWFALAAVVHGFAASRWMAALMAGPAAQHSSAALVIVLSILAVGFFVSIYARAFLLKPLDAAQLDDAEREALEEWCSEGKIAAPGAQSMQPASFFWTAGRWARGWRLAVIGAWLLAIGCAPLLGANAFEVTGLGIVGFPLLYLGYRAGFHILARINPYDRPNGFLSTVTGIVFFYAVTWTAVSMFPPTPTGPGSFGPMPPP